MIALPWWAQALVCLCVYLAGYARGWQRHEAASRVYLIHYPDDVQ